MQTSIELPAHSFSSSTHNGPFSANIRHNKCSPEQPFLPTAVNYPSHHPHFSHPPNPPHSSFPPSTSSTKVGFQSPTTTTSSHPSNRPSIALRSRGSNATSSVVVTTFGSSGDQKEVNKEVNKFVAKDTDLLTRMSFQGKSTEI